MQESSQDNIAQKKILIDTTFLFDQYSFRGIGKYGKEVIKRIIKLAVQENVEVHLAGFYDLKKNLIALGLSQFSVEQYLKVVQFYSFDEAVDSSIGNIKRWDITYKPAIEQIKPHIFFSANFERGLPSVWYFRKHLSHIPRTIIMAHDAIPLATGSYSSKSILHNFLKGLFYKFMFSGIRNADIVLTNSNYSKNDLIRYGKIKEEKILPIYLGIDERFFEKTPEVDVKHVMKAFGLEAKQYFIYDSGLEKNKGIGDLIKIFSLILKSNNRDMPTKLVLVGKDFSKAGGAKIQPKNERAEKVLKEFKANEVLENIVTTDRVSDEDLMVLIKESYCYFNFSRYEGFSFGPLQSMAAMVPTVVGNYSCIPEVTKEKAFLVNSQNHVETSAKILSFLNDEAYKANLAKQGKEVVLSYNWDFTAEKTWELFKTLL